HGGAFDAPALACKPSEELRKALQRVVINSLRVFRQQGAAPFRYLLMAAFGQFDEACAGQVCFGPVQAVMKQALAAAWKPLGQIVFGQSELSGNGVGNIPDPHRRVRLRHVAQHGQHQCLVVGNCHPQASSFAATLRNFSNASSRLSTLSAATSAGGGGDCRRARKDEPSFSQPSKVSGRWKENTRRERASGSARSCTIHPAASSWASIRVRARSSGL